MCVLLFLCMPASACIWMLHYKLSTCKFFNTLEQIAIMICLHTFSFFFSSYTHSYIRHIHVCVYSYMHRMQLHTYIYVLMWKMLLWCCDVHTSAAERKCAKKNSKNVCVSVCVHGSMQVLWPTPQMISLILNLEHTNKLLHCSNVCFAWKLRRASVIAKKRLIAESKVKLHDFRAVDSKQQQQQGGFGKKIFVNTKATANGINNDRQKIKTHSQTHQARWKRQDNN